MFMVKKRKLLKVATIVITLSVVIALFSSFAFAGKQQSMAKDEILKLVKEKYAGETITVLCEGGEIGFMEGLLPEFERKTGVKVGTFAIPGPQLFSKLMTGFLAGRVKYDTFELRQDSKGPLSTFTLDLTELNKKYDFSISDIIPPWRTLALYPTSSGIKSENPVMIDFPYDADYHAFFWRKDYFEKVGLDPNNPPVDFDQLVEYAKKLNGRDLNGDGEIEYGFGPRMSRWGARIGFSTVLNAFGANYFEENWEPAINSPVAVKALQWWLDIRKYSVPNYQELSWNTLFEAFARGDFAMCWNFTHYYPELVTEEGKWLYGTSLPPAGSFGTPHNITDGASGYAVVKASKKKELTYLFLRYISCNETHKKLLLESNVTYDVGVAYEETLYDPEFRAKYPKQARLVERLTKLTLQSKPVNPRRSYLSPKRSCLSKSSAHCENRNCLRS